MNWAQANRLQPGTRLVTRGELWIQAGDAYSLPAQAVLIFDGLSSMPWDFAAELGWTDNWDSDYDREYKCISCHVAVPTVDPEGGPLPSSAYLTDAFCLLPKDVYLAKDEE